MILLTRRFTRTRKQRGPVSSTLKRDRSLDYKLEEAYGMKSLVESLFGNKAWLEVKHSTDVKIWKKYALRILSAIETSAEATVEIADSDWFNELHSLVEFWQGRIKGAENTEMVFASLAASLANINFHQLGFIPSNVLQKQITLRHKSNWKLDVFRSVQYVQTKKQIEAKEEYKKNIAAASPKT